jgi:hypothetical protein
MSRITQKVAPIVVATILYSCSKQPPTDRNWNLTIDAANLCQPAGSMMPLKAFVLTDSYTDNFQNTHTIGYTSRDRRAGGTFNWRVLPNTDPFWTARARPVTWFGSASIDDNGDFLGGAEGVVAVEVRYNGKTDTKIFTVIPSVRVEIEPIEPHVKVHDWTTFTIRAEFTDGRPAPAVPPPQLDPVGEGNALMMAGNPNSKGERFGPWYAYVNAVASGRHKLRLRYLGYERDLYVVAEGVAEAKPNPEEIETARHGAFPTDDTPITDPILARRVAAMAGHCVYSDDNIPAGDTPERD